MPSTLSFVLTAADIDRYRRDGFLVVEGFASRDACAALRQRAVDIVEQWEPTAERTVFTTDQQERTSNREFLDSAGSVWCFFEADAFDESGELAQDKSLSINKIGHAMHDLDPVFESFSYTPELAAVASDIGMSDPLAIQSMYIFKQPHIGGEVKCHQDATFLYTEPLSVVGFWFAIEDATIENGCMWAEPGGHRGPLRERFERAGATNDDGTRFVALDPTPTAATARWTRADRGGGGNAGRPRRTAPPLERRQPFGDEPPRLQPPLHRRRGAVSRHRTGCSVRPRCRCAPSPEWRAADAGALPRLVRAGAEGAPP